MNVFPESNVVVGVDAEQFIPDVIVKAIMDRGLKVRVSASWQTRRSTLEGVLDYQWLSIYDHWQEAIVSGDEYIGHLQLNPNAHRLTVTVSGMSAEIGRKVVADIRKKFKEERVEVDPHVIPINFWSNTSSRGPRAIERDIVVPMWDEIQDNYEAKTLVALNNQFTEFKPSKGGQLILWHGLPGTGKTFALRSLMRAWVEWCSGEYIVDPERFFGDAEYMMNVLLEDTRVPTFLSSDDEDEDDEKAKNRWRLLICEDTGELLMEDAKDITGQGLSRLLNVVDGLIGQGLRVLILITTNEKLEKMHPAVTRPGRAAYNIEFNALSASEADAWSTAHGLTPEGKSTTVAALYGALEGFQKGPKSNGKAPMGFRPPTTASSPHGHTKWSDIRRNDKG